MKKYVLIAGVNGAGKSTLYQILAELQEMPRVNTDEILREFGDWRNMKDVTQAGKIAVSKIADNFSKDISFNQETTLCGKSILRNVELAKQKGYHVELHYVGVESVEIAKERVRTRVSKGGHGIPEKDIEKRYIETFQNLKKMISRCDLIAFYDNTDVFRRFAIYKNGMPVRVSSRLPKWYQEFVLK
ncbi:MAG: zeta toxin family protein [Lachnospiraceae bacterium]|nr:zeta toxin family protein [Lachnospiraceae bacterium]